MPNVINGSGTFDVARASIVFIIDADGFQKRALLPLDVLEKIAGDDLKTNQQVMAAYSANKEAIDNLVQTTVSKVGNFDELVISEELITALS